MAAVGADALEQFADYEAYLDSQVSETDMYYPEDEEMARQLVEPRLPRERRHVKKGRVRGEASSVERKRHAARERAQGARVAREGPVRESASRGAGVARKRS